MDKKILAFVYDGKKFLILRNNPKDSAHGGDYWFTVTGSVEADESLEDAVKREVEEETNLNISEIFDLKWGSIYSWGGEDHSENNFLAFVKKGKVILNEEHIDFEWLGLDDFVGKINWSLDKEELKKVLEKALRKELFFNKEKIDDFRKRTLKKNSKNTTWQGVLLEESLEDKSLMDLVSIKGTSASKLEEENRTMTFHKVEVQDSDKQVYLDRAMHVIKPAFYTHLCRNGEMYVVFRGAMFNFRKGDPELKRAREYGKSIGIIEAQMPFERLVDHPFD